MASRLGRRGLHDLCGHGLLAEPSVGPVRPREQVAADEAGAWVRGSRRGLGNVVGDYVVGVTLLTTLLLTTHSCLLLTTYYYSLTDDVAQRGGGDVGGHLGQRQRGALAWLGSRLGSGKVRVQGEGEGEEEG